MAIVLIGFMGAGKSTIGRALSEKLNLPFVDLDTYIEEQEAQRIPKIFELKGEDYFRALEHAALKQWISKDVVLATGGGIVEKPNNIALLKNNKHNIWVDTNIETLYNRIARDLNRPNAINRTKKDIFDLYIARCSRYNEIAYIKVDTHASVSTCVADIITRIQADE